ncbi:hypothetical protein FRB96_005987 [Tulasnella sp. 330]|nr:hypothetical protein FRB96_005987 [Tulasnella sp. 330]KAG8887729.1 hypothetical protein FRB98_009113 [Tulasnella sp. 332]
MRVLSSLPFIFSLAFAASPTAQVYLLPPIPDQRHPSSTPSLNQFDANSAISHHLGFDVYETAADRAESWWKEMGRILTGGNGVGQGTKDSVLIVIQSDYPQDFDLSKPDFTIENSPPSSMFTDLIHAYVERAYQAGDSVFSSLSPTIESIKQAVSPVYKALLDAFDVTSPAVETFVKELEMLAGFVDGDEVKAATDTTQEFSAFEVKGLAEVQVEKGRDSEQYITAAKAMQAVLSNPALQGRRTAIIVVPVEHTTNPSPSHRKSKRQQKLLSPDHPSAGPVFSVSTCFTSNSTCADTTNNCSGHGSCTPTTRAGKTCYTCSCAVTRNEAGRRQWWAGGACEKLDLSTSFTLLAGSAIFLIVLVIFSVGLLYSIGSQQLPNTLTAGAVSGHAKKD